MNWFNKVGASASPTAFGGGATSRVSPPKERSEDKEVQVLRSELNHLNARIEKLKTVVHSSLRWCETCEFSWMTTIHKACPSCHSRDSEYLGWIEYFEDASPEDNDLEESPAEGGEPRRGDESNNNNNGGLENE